MSPTTNRKIEANRANSLHSTGPRTEAGKVASSRNSISHGLTSRSALLPDEDPDLYLAHCKSYYDAYRPVSGLQTELLEELASIRWRLHRVPVIEAQLLNLEMEAIEANPEEEPAHACLNGDPDRLLALAFQRLTKFKVLSNLYQLEGRLTRRAEKLHTILFAMAAEQEGQRALSQCPMPFPITAPPSVPAENLQNEPTTTVNATQKVGRNESCPCGSGLKFKRCCIAKTQPLAYAA